MNKNKKLNHLSQIEIPNNNNPYFCMTCEEFNLYVLDTENVTLTLNNVTFTYEELQPLCIKCGNPMYVPEIHDINHNRRLEAYKEAYKKEATKPFTTNSNTKFSNQKLYPSSINK